MKKLIFFLLLLPGILEAQLTVTQHNPPSGYTNVQVRAFKKIKFDQQDNLWMTFGSIGLGKYDGTTWTMYDKSNSGLPSDTLSCIDIEPNGVMWLGTRLGLARYDGTNWTVYNTSNSGIPADSISEVHVVPNGIWIGTAAGASFFDGSTFQNYNTGNSGLISDSITSFASGTPNRVWIGTKGGVSKFDNNTWTSYDSSNTILETNNIFSLEEDLSGDLWIMLADSVGLYVIRNTGQTFSFCDDLYYDYAPCGIFKTNLESDPNGSLTFFNKTGQVVVMNPSYNFYYGAQTFPGNFGCDFDYNSSGELWIVNRTTFFRLYQHSFSGYQHPFDITTIYNAKALEVNDVSALITNRGDMHWDLLKNYYEVPKGKGDHSVYSSALWIGGYDATGDLHVAAQTYRQTGTDFWPGPITGMDIPFDFTSSREFNKVWSVYRYQIEEFKTNFLNGSVSNGTYTIPEAMFTWPAKGNFHITDNKAPFVDYNTDNNYNPYDGDYPLIKGDQMIFWIFNDSLSDHTESYGEKLGIEVHASAYAFACPGIADSNQVLNWTTLYNYRIINVSFNNYDSLYLGLWCDNDLGDAFDDYVGCDTIRAAGFAYNGDNNDNQNNMGWGYGLNPPMQNVQVLKGMLANTGDGSDNDLDGVIDENGERTTMNHFIYYNGINNTPDGQPVNAPDFYNYMHSVWLDGLHLSYGGTGRPGSVGNTGQPTNFIFSGTPYGSGWTEYSSGNLPEDRRFIMGSGPITLPAGGETSIDFAYVFTWDSLSPNGLTTSIARNIADLERVKRWFDTDSFPSCMVYSVGVEEMLTGKQPQFVVYPVPVSDWLTLKSDFPINDARIEIRDLFGRLIWTGKYSGKEIYTGHLSAGQYFIRIIAKTFTGSQKFVKQ